MSLKSHLKNFSISFLSFGHSPSLLSLPVIQTLTLYALKVTEGVLWVCADLSICLCIHLIVKSERERMGKVGRMKLGSQGLQVSAQGLGCMGMSAFYGPPKPESEMIALIHHAVQCGVTFLDTSDVYGPHTNELLLAKVRLRLRLTRSFDTQTSHNSSCFSFLNFTYTI